jgi:hypothetical protein
MSFNMGKLVAGMVTQSQGACRGNEAGGARVTHYAGWGDAGREKSVLRLQGASHWQMEFVGHVTFYEDGDCRYAPCLGRAKAVGKNSEARLGQRRASHVDGCHPRWRAPFNDRQREIRRDTRLT